MTQYKTLTTKLSNLQHSKLKSKIKNGTQVTINLSSNLIGDDETNFPHKFLLTNTLVSTVNIELSKPLLSKMVQLRGFGSFLVIRGFLNPEEQVKSVVKLVEKLIPNSTKKRSLKKRKIYHCMKN